MALPRKTVPFYQLFFGFRIASAAKLNQKTKHLARLLLLGFFFCSGALALQGAHIIGGEITYECLGYTDGDSTTNSRRYQFVMKIYRDCLGGGADFDSAPLGAFQATVTIYAGDMEVTTLQLGAPTVVSVDPDPGNPCVIVPSNICVESGTYVFPEIDLPIIDESYYIVYQRCCRNNTISNILEPGASGATYFIELTAAAQETCNNSPTFNNFPPVVLCANQPFNFDSSASDAEGDQLVYEFCSPVLGGGLNFDMPSAADGIAPDPDLPPPYLPVEFLAPNYGPSNPLGDDAIELNTQTGLLSGFPPFIGQFVVGVCVSEYRNGELLSTVRRDFQFNVTNCEVPVAAAVRDAQVLPDGTFLFESCGDPVFDFVNESGQVAFINDYQWNFYLPDSTVQWNTRDASVTFPGPGNYSGLLALNPGTTCGDSADLLINVFPEVEADFTYEYDTCIAGPVIFDGEIYSDEGVIDQWVWDFGDGSQSAERDPIHRYLEPGEREVRLVVTDTNGCQDLVARNITFFPVPALIVLAPSSYEGCAPASLFFDNLSTPIDDTYEVNWDFGDGGVATGIDAEHVFTQTGLFDISLEIISPIGCRTDTVFEELIEIFPRPTADFVYAPEQVDNFDPTVRFTNLSDNAAYWLWDFNAGQYATAVRDPVYTFPDTGLQVIRLLATHPLGCRDTAEAIIDVEPRITYHLPNAFSPNGDSVNDRFYGSGFLVGLRQFELQIWNRWGELLFQTTDPAAAWDGNFGGQAAPAGVYVCLVRYTGPRGEKVEQKSMVTLIR